MRSVIVRECRNILCGSLFLVGAVASFAQYPNGIYAEFSTSMGSFTCRLEYALAPKAVANFIGLASGERAWLDLPSGIVRNNQFYNGVTFHRVIAGFMNQSGSPNGQGTDGPGYAFVDEFSPNLRHDSFGVLSSANSGPDSNGAQFFITVEPTPWLNDVHTVFGRLYGGSNVVYAINHVATDGSDKPLTNVVIQSVTIQRIGAAAQSFDIHAQGLPVVTNVNTWIKRVGGNVSLTFSNLSYADNRLYSSTNLNQWAGNELGIETTSPATNAAYQPIVGNRAFFRTAQIRYASSTFAPKNMLNRTLTLNFNGGVGTIVIMFNSSGGGTYTYSGGQPGTVESYIWIQRPYNGQLWPIYYSGLVTMTLSLNYTNGGSGTFSGTAYTAPSFQVSGGFSHTP